jgi:HK97 family phage major capsid protein
MEQAEALAERADAASKAAHLAPQTEDEADQPDVKSAPTSRTIRDIMADAGYTDEQSAAVVKALAQVDAPTPAAGNIEAKRYGFNDFLRAVRYEDRASLKAMGARLDSDPEAKDLLESGGASGGYLVPTEQLSELLMVGGSPAVVRPRARIIPMSRRSVTMPALDQGDVPSQDYYPDYYGGVHAKWTEEGGTKTETEPAFKQIELVAHKLAGYTQASDELLADEATGLESVLQMLFAEAIGFREDYAFLRGNGVGQPLGILNSGALIASARDTANEVSYGDIATMWSRLHPASVSSAVWLVDQTALLEFLTMEDTAGNNVFMPQESGGARQSVMGTVFGRPLIVTEKLPTLGTQGDVLLADMAYYLIGDRQQTTIASSIHYAFVDDLTTWRFVHRVDGQPWLDEPIYIDTTNTVSPFVALAA